MPFYRRHSHLGSLISVFLMIGLYSAAMAGDLDSLQDPGTTLSYTLEDLFNRLNAGADGTQNIFTEPVQGPVIGTMHTINEIMEKAPAVDGSAAADAGNVMNGKTFWGLKPGGGWGLKTGTLPSQNPDSTTVNQEAGVYEAFDLSTVDTDLAGTNIRAGQTIFGVQGDFNVVNTSSGDALEGDILVNKKAWVGGLEVIGTVLPGDNLTGTDGFLTISVPDGLYTGGKTTTANDSNLLPEHIKKDVAIFGVTGTQFACAVEKTGQVIKFGPRDDGALEKGVPFPLPRFTDNNNGTVTDNMTGLVWLKNADYISIDGTQGNTTWVDALNFCNNLENGLCNLTDGSVIGTWRLPSVKELESLINFGHSRPALSNALGTGKWSENNAFTSVQFNYYWSSTTYLPSIGAAWGVGLHVGQTAPINKGSAQYVWPVRDGE